MVKLNVSKLFKTYFYIYRGHMGQKYEPFTINEDIRKIIVRHKCECLSCDVRSDIAQFHSQYKVTICLIYVAKVCNLVLLKVHTGKFVSNSRTSKRLSNCFEGLKTKNY